MEKLFRSKPQERLSRGFEASTAILLQDGMTYRLITPPHKIIIYRFKKVQLRQHNAASGCR
jgi:hypothetical protein